MKKRRSKSAARRASARATSDLLGPGLMIPGSLLREGDDDECPNKLFRIGMQYGTGATEKEATDNLEANARKLLDTAAKECTKKKCTEEKGQFCDSDGLVIGTQTLKVAAGAKTLKHKIPVANDAWVAWGFLLWGCYCVAKEKDF